MGCTLVGSIDWYYIMVGVTNEYVIKLSSPVSAET